jgi:hypothetical protein
LQFHTPRSYEVKQTINHPLYERQRLLPQDSLEAIKLRARQVENTQAIPIPPGVENIK